MEVKYEGGRKGEGLCLIIRYWFFVKYIVSFFMLIICLLCMMWNVYGLGYLFVKVLLVLVIGFLLDGYVYLNIICFFW